MNRFNIKITSHTLLSHVVEYGKVILDGRLWRSELILETQLTFAEVCELPFVKSVERIDDMNNKPPLGVTPKHIHEMIRVQDLCRALQDYAHNDTSINNYEVMLKWSEELTERLYSLKFDKEIEMGV